MQRKVGKGFHSELYEATDLHCTNPSDPDRTLSVIVLSQEYNGSEADFSAVKRYVRRLAVLKHLNIVRILDCERDDVTVFATMEYVTGDSLESRLGDFRAGEARSIISSISNALIYAHDHTIVHGQLMPSNILITADRSVKLVNFHITPWSDRLRTTELSHDAVQEASPILTSGYASPQVVAKRSPETTDDVYTLACITYRLITGRHPFDNGTGVLARRYPPPRPELSSNEYAAIVRALEVEPANRTPSVGEFMDAFRSSPKQSRSTGNCGGEPLPGC